MAAELKIVVVEDHEGLNALLCRALRQAGHEVWGLANAEEVSELPALIDVDVFVVDWNLPTESGLALAERLRHRFPGAILLMVTARSGTDDLLDAYAAGVDLFLSKPIKAQDVLRGIEVVISRKRGQPGERGDRPCTDKLLLDRQRLQLSAGSKTIDITLTEASLLAAFSAASEQTLEPWQLLQVMSGTDMDITPRALEVRLSRLRKKLATVTPGNALPFIKGRGYRLTCEVDVA